MDKISLDIPNGLLTVLIGPSGCGKSTLLKLIMGLEEPDSGSIEWADEKQTNEFERRHAIGYVIQDGGLFPHLTAWKNISLVADYKKWPQERVRQRMHELSDLVQMEMALLRKFPVQLSGGQRQRVGLMRALFLDPELLLLDEPLGALDPMVRADLQQDLKSIFQSLQKTVILVTHDMGEAVYFADRIVILRDGNVIQQGQTEDLIRRPADPFVTQFIKAQRNPLEQFMREA